MLPVALFVAACGGSKSTTTTATKSTTTTATNTTARSATSSTTSPSQAEIAPDQAIAEKSLLRLADFPSGWEQQDQPGVGNSVHCPGIQVAKAAASARRAAPQFANGKTKYVNDIVYVYPDVGTAHRSFAQLSSRATRLCAGNAVAKQVAKVAAAEKNTTVTVGQMSTGELAIPPAGDQAAGGRVTVPYTAAGLGFSAVIDLVFVRVRRASRILLFEDATNPFDPAFEAQLTQIAVRRLGAQLNVPTGNRTTTTQRAASSIGSTTHAASGVTTKQSTAAGTRSAASSANTPTTTQSSSQASTTSTRTTSNTQSSPTAQAVQKAEQALAACRMEQPGITLQELETEAASPLGIQC